MLRDVAGAGDVGADFGNFPQPNPGRGSVGFGLGALDRLFRADVHVPVTEPALGPSGTFWAYAGVCLAGFVFISLRVPETKGKSLEQIEKELVD